MKICPNCQHTVSDDAAFCTTCGTAFANPQPQQPQQTPPPQQPYTPPYTPPYTAPQPTYAPIPDPYDHTAEFEAADISENKVVCMLVYLLDFIGIIIALLIGKESAYTQFHVRQALKFTVLEAVLGVVAVVGAFTFIVPIAAAVCVLILLVLKIICFFQVCAGQAKEPAIVRDLKFLK